MKSPTKTKVFSVRVDPEAFKVALELKIDLAEEFRLALKKKIAERKGACSKCGRKK